MSKKIDITSTAVEKGLDTAKGFLDKLIMPAVEEVGLLLKDQVAMWKFKNQVKMLNKAKQYCENNKINPKTISLKVLCPMLEYSAIEEDDILKDKWAILLSNMVDSEQNIENHVFPYILSQLSSKEFHILENVYNDKLTRIERITKELIDFKENYLKYEQELKTKIETLKQDISDNKYNDVVWGKQKELWDIQYQLKMLPYKESSLKSQMVSPAKIPFDALKEFEFSNLIRLGLVKEEKEYYASSGPIEIPNDRDDYRYSTRVDVDIDISSDTEMVLTELGELFINACKEKSLKIK